MCVDWFFKMTIGFIEMLISSIQHSPDLLNLSRKHESDLLSIWLHFILCIIIFLRRQYLVIMNVITMVFDGYVVFLSNILRASQIVYTCISFGCFFFPIDAYFQTIIDLNDLHCYRNNFGWIYSALGI